MDIEGTEMGPDWRGGEGGREGEGGRKRVGGGVEERGTEGRG